MAEIIKRGRNWYYRYTNADGRRVMEKGCSDRRATEGLAAQAEARVARIRAGLSDAKEEACQQHAARPLGDHLDDFQRYLTDKGGTKNHAVKASGRNYFPCSLGLWGTIVMS